MKLELMRIPYQPYTWARVYADSKEVGAIKNPNGVYDIMPSSHPRFETTNISNVNQAMKRCYQLNEYYKMLNKFEKDLAEVCI